VDYLRPARPDDSLVVETEVLVAGNASATLHQTVRGVAGVCAALVVKLACVRLPTGPLGLEPGGSKPERLPPRWRTVLLAMRDARPAGRATGAVGGGTGIGGSGGSSS
jgi:acyl-CoA thioester hydrolase